jgi:hypothetical protein
MNGRNKGIRCFSLRNRKKSKITPKRLPKRLFLGVRLKGDLTVLCPVLKMEGKNEQA